MLVLLPKIITTSRSPFALRRFSLTALSIALVLFLAACSISPVKKLPPVAPEISAPSDEKKVEPKVELKIEPKAELKIEPKAETLRAVSFTDLVGWAEDDVRQAWPAFIASCDALNKRAVWKEVCASAVMVNAEDVTEVRNFFEGQFIPHVVSNADGSKNGMITGYYEPLLRGSRTRIGKYQIPLYRVPDDLLTIDLSAVYPELKNMRLRGRVVGNKVVPYFSRAEMTDKNSLVGKELVWVDNVIEAFFLQVQGSGRVYLEETQETIRVAYADQNGHPYKSIGRYLVDRGDLKLEQASAQGIASWAAANPARLQELLNVNPSVVFFREEKLSAASKGPKGALGVPLTAQRSIAIDAQFIPLGAPVFLATTQPNSDQPLRRLMLAQDTGGAIRGAVRADFFWGFGAEAGERAGRMKQSGAMWVLLPKALAKTPSLNELKQP
jgi:membrane-bound lytic murein transglycosylase A